MISQYSKPKDIDREFWKEYPKALYWLKKTTSRSKVRDKILDDDWEVIKNRKEYSISEPVFYTSPQTGNRWLTWLMSKRDKQGEPHIYCRAALYYFTEVYMTMMLPILIVETDNETGEALGEYKGVNVYTAHMFQRMADPDRLGVDMSDRVRAMLNFSEFVAAGWSDTRPPREGEKNMQVLMRAPGSWIRGHTVKIKDRHVTIYRTFYTDKSMSYKQLKDVRSFKKFADERMNKNK